MNLLIRHDLNNTTCSYCQDKAITLWGLNHFWSGLHYIWTCEEHTVSLKVLDQEDIEKVIRKGWGAV